MSIVKMKTKGQLTIPTALRKRLRIDAGDLLEVQEEGGKITIIPKSLIDRKIAESVEQYRKGKSFGPFADANTAIDYLHKEVKKRGKQIKRL
jgi:AbrB family looped-hinge helix DNA binding protein